MDSTLAVTRAKADGAGRRRRRTATHIAKWSSRYTETPLKDLIHLAYYSSTRELGSGSVESILQKYATFERQDYFDQWQMYCRAISEPEYSNHFAVAIYEGAVDIVANTFLQDEPNKWLSDKWLSLCRESLRWLKENKGGKAGGLSDGRGDEAGVVNEAAHQSSLIPSGSPDNSYVEPHSTPAFPNPSQGALTQLIYYSWHMPSRIYADGAEMDKLKVVLGDFLFIGLQQVPSESGARAKLTKVGLPSAKVAKFAGVELVIRLPELWGKIIRNTQLVNEYQNMLGDFVFNAMEASAIRVEEKATGNLAHTNAVQVDFHEPGLSTLKVILEFYQGIQLWKHAFINV